MVHTFKVVVLGDSGVGKTSLLTRLVKDEFRGAAATRSTISAAFVNKRIDVDGEAVNLEVWDPAGQERFRSLNTPMYYRGAAGAVVCYDITDAESFEHVPGWYAQLQMMGERGVVVALCASKLDLASDGGRNVLMADAARFADNQNLAVFHETSAKTGESVEELFATLAASMLQRHQSGQGAFPETLCGKGVLKLGDGTKRRPHYCC